MKLQILVNLIVVKDILQIILPKNVSLVTTFVKLVKIHQQTVFLVQEYSTYKQEIVTKIVHFPIQIMSLPILV
jgi:hypothetical protein